MANRSRAVREKRIPNVQTGNTVNGRCISNAKWLGSTFSDLLLADTGGHQTGKSGVVRPEFISRSAAAIKGIPRCVLSARNSLRDRLRPLRQPLDALLRNLKRRIAKSKDFPHEIGLFLGYPIEDVVGFIRYAGKGCKLSGLWKVYGDAEAASRLFDRLSRVCHAVTRRVDKGETLLEVFAA